MSWNLVSHVEDGFALNIKCDAPYLGALMHGYVCTLSYTHSLLYLFLYHNAITFGYGCLFPNIFLGHPNACVIWLFAHGG